MTARLFRLQGSAIVLSVSSAPGQRRVVGWMAVCELGEAPSKNIKKSWERISWSDGQTCLGEAPSRNLKKGLWDAEGLQKPFMIKWR